MHQDNANAVNKASTNLLAFHPQAKLRKRKKNPHKIEILLKITLSVHWNMLGYFFST